MSTLRNHWYDPAIMLSETNLDIYYANGGSSVVICVTFFSYPSGTEGGHNLHLFFR